MRKEVETPGSTFARLSCDSNIVCDCLLLLRHNLAFLFLSTGSLSALACIYDDVGYNGQSNADTRTVPLYLDPSNTLWRARCDTVYTSEPCSQADPRPFPSPVFDCLQGKGLGDLTTWGDIR